MKGKIRILIVDDHAIVRYGLNSLFGTQKDMTVVGQAKNGVEALKLAQSTRPDVAIVDLVMPKMDGAETTARMKELLPAVKVVILTSFGMHEGVVRALEAGADGAILKTAEDETLVPTVRRVVAGERVISAEIQRQAVEVGERPQLSERQVAILSGLVRGLTNNDIGKMLNVSPFLVRDQLKVIFAKLGAANRTEAATIAVSRHLVQSQ